ncbi:MAG TPA: thioredoxin [Candidatus Saccharimonadales bacterium]|nr:thioredoxin [Candidatus Saccharimonadales bacterium]
MAIELLDFRADWCGPCKVMDPIIEQIEGEYSGKLSVRKIDVDEDNDTAYSFGVMSIPTYIVLKDGKEVERAIGSQPKETLIQKIVPHLS